MAQPNLAQVLRGAVMRWDATHPASQFIDPNAEMAIASHEGLSGGIGDGGHAFGPNQENNAGGVLTGRFRGMSPQQINAWAWSQPGLNDAFSHIAAVAGGERGAQAIKDIATKFERPANVQAEITDALAHYGGGSPNVPARTLASAGAPNPSSAAPAGNLSGLLGGLISQTNQSLGLGSGQPASLIDMFKGPALAAWGNHPGTGGKVGGKPGQGQKGLPPRGPSKMSPLDGIEVDATIAPQVRQLLAAFPGVRPTSGYRDPAHNAAVGGVSNSDHLRGDAVDFGGNPQQLSALYKYAQGRFPYVEPMPQARNHVHISFARNGR
jgi:hypothetical protein